MFILSRVEDIVVVAPRFLHGGERRTVRREVSRRYLNRVLPGVGLVCELYDILSVEPGVVYPGRTGDVHCKVVFRLLVFKPFEGEVIDGFVGGADATGLRLSLVFFDGIHVPIELLGLPDDQAVHEADGTWSLIRDGQRLRFTVGGHCRFRVTKVQFNSEQAILGGATPEAGGTRFDAVSGGGGFAVHESVEVDSDLALVPENPTRLLSAPESTLKVPLELVASMGEENLGMLAWRLSVAEDAGNAMPLSPSVLNAGDESDLDDAEEDELLQDELVDDEGAFESSASDSD